MIHKKKLFFTLFVFTCVVAQANAQDVHDALFEATPYPSAVSCKACHPVHYKEWSVSPHAYAQLSPVFNAMHAKITKLTNGTSGDFCIRCHSPLGMNNSEPIFISNLDRPQVTREGVSCVVCHRRTQPFGKVSARFPLAAGDIFEPVYGPTGNKELKRVIESGKYDVVTERGQPGRAIHTDVIWMPQIVTSGFCGSCHDVHQPTGFRLEEAFSEYKASPAARKGISCQDCHMGKVPGVPAGYAHEPVAIIAGKPTTPRKRTNHMFIGPDYSVVHPGIFPHNPAAQEVAALREWLQFNFVKGWGTDEFEDNITEDYEFPKRWVDVSDRYDARAIIDENLELLETAADQRRRLLQAGYRLGDIVINKAGQGGIQFKVEIKNVTDGHNVPTGFDAERLVFLQVTVTDKEERVVFQSGDLDPNGDVRDAHSIYVHNGELPVDKYLFSLQSKFLVSMVRGGEREQVLAVNYSPDPLPFIRPPTHATFLSGRPAGARKHRKTIRPLSSKWAKYKVKHSQLNDSAGPYKANIKIIAAMVPVNLVYEIQDMGFDYGMSPRDVADAVVAGHQVLWERDVVLQPGRIEEEPVESFDYELGYTNENNK